MKYQAAIFDLDGTLLDTLADISNAANETLWAEGFPQHSPADYRRFIGDGIELFFARALPADAVSVTMLSRCVRRYRECYEEHWHDQTRPYDGIADLLAELQQRGVLLAVLSNKSHPFTVRCVEHFFPQTKFACVLGQRAGVPLKPDPAGAREILAHLRLAPGEVIYVGDTSTDMQTAAAAGLLAVGVLWGFREREELLRYGAQAIIAHPRELLAYF